MNTAARLLIVQKLYLFGFFCKCCPDIERVLTHEDLEHSPDDYEIKHTENCEGVAKMKELLGWENHE